MELCSGGRVHQPVRDRGGERPAHGEVAPSLGFDAQVLAFMILLYRDCKLYVYVYYMQLRHEYSQQPFYFGFIQSLHICPMIADYIFGCQLRRESRNSLSFSVQKLCSTHKLCICPMNGKLFLNVCHLREFYNGFICRSTISAFVLFGEAQANDICHNMQLIKYILFITKLDCCFNSRLKGRCAK